jgi:hypothetical protein
MRTLTYDNRSHMDTIAERYFLLRQLPKANYLRNRTKTTPFSSLVEAVFQHQIAVFDATTALRTASFKAGALRKQVELAAQFYLHCYKPAGLQRGREGGNEIDLHEFFASALKPKTELHKRNHITYLLGDVGVGKTSYINYLISNYGSKWVQKEYWFARVDLEKATKARPLTLDRFVGALASKLHAIFAEHAPLLVPQTSLAQAEFNKQLASLRQLGLSDAGEDDAEQPLVRATWNVRAQRLHSFLAFLNHFIPSTPILIFDNIDFVCHLCDRSLFKNPEQETSMLSTVCDIIRTFFDNTDEFGSIGANVIFVMRNDTYDLLTETPHTSLPESSLFRDSHAFTIRRPTWDQVLERRASLLSYAYNRTDIDRRHKPAYDGLVRLMREDLQHPTGNERLSLIDHLEKLANYGLRGIVEFLCDYGWMTGEEEISNPTAAFKRMADQYPAALLTFILGGHDRFSQFWSNFPNVYLICAQDFSHIHSYWLKRLILEFLKAKTVIGEDVRPEQVIRIFCAEGTGYAERLVIEILDSLSEANSSNLLRCTRTCQPGGTSLRISRIALTPRAERFLSCVCDRFFYLQLVVDDHLLPIPRHLMQDFRVSNDYAYLVAHDPHLYHQKAAQMITIKIRQVVLFLDVLEASLAAEKTAFPKVFVELTDFQGVRLPNLDDIRRGILNEISSLAKHFNIALKPLFHDISLCQSETRRALDLAYANMYAAPNAIKPLQ